MQPGAGLYARPLGVVIDALTELAAIDPSATDATLTMGQRNGFTWTLSVTKNPDTSGAN